MRWAILAATVFIVATAVWPDSLETTLAVACTLAVGLLLLAFVLRQERKTAESIRANVGQAMARTDRLLGRK